MQEREKKKTKVFRERQRRTLSQTGPWARGVPYSCRGGVGYSWSRGAVVSGQDVREELGSPVTGAGWGRRGKGSRLPVSESRAGAPRPRAGRRTPGSQGLGSRRSGLWGPREEGTELAGLRGEEEEG